MWIVTFTSMSYGLTSQKQASIIVSCVFLIFYSLCRYESGALAYIWPLGRVTLSLHNPFLTNQTLASAVLDDISYPETQIVLEDIHLMYHESAEPFIVISNRRVRYGHTISISSASEPHAALAMFKRLVNYGMFVSYGSYCVSWIVHCELLLVINTGTNHPYHLM